MLAFIVPIPIHSLEGNKKNGCLSIKKKSLAYVNNILLNLSTETNKTTLNEKKKLVAFSN